MKGRLAALGIVALAILVVLGGVVGEVLTFTGRRETDMNAVSSFMYLLNPILLGALGGLLLLRRRRHWAGRTLLGAGVAAVLSALSKGVMAHHVADHHWADGLAPWAAWYDNWTWTVQIGAVTYTMLRFAGTGRSGRVLRAVGWVGIGAFGLLIPICMAAETSSTYAGLRTAIHLPHRDQAIGTLVGPLFLIAVLGMVTATAAVFVHRRQVAGVEQAQLRWLVWAFGVVIGSLVINELAIGVMNLLHTHPVLLRNALDVLSQVGFFALPIAIYVSVSRHGLFEIDRVVSRTISYSLIVGLLTVGYSLVVGSVSQLVPARLGSLPVAAATLGVVALFVPLRRRITLVIDRRFNRGRYDARGVVDAFAERVRREGANDPNGRDLLTAVHAVFQPTHAGVWLVPAGPGEARVG